MAGQDFSAMASWIAAALLCLSFIRALLHKLGDGLAFRADLANYRIVPERWVPLVAMLLPALEGVAVVALALPLPSTRRVGSVLAACLLAVYALAIAVNLWRGRVAIDCGCGGGGQGISWLHVARNGLLLGLCALAAAGEAGPLPGVASVFVAVACVGVLWLLLLVFDQLLGNHGHAVATTYNGL